MYKIGNIELDLQKTPNSLINRISDNPTLSTLMCDAIIEAEKDFIAYLLDNNNAV